MWCKPIVSLKSTLTQYLNMTCHHWAPISWERTCRSRNGEREKIEREMKILLESNFLINQLYLALQNDLASLLEMLLSSWWLIVIIMINEWMLCLKKMSLITMSNIAWYYSWFFSSHRYLISLMMQLRLYFYLFVNLTSYFMFQTTMCLVIHSER
jgi:hypothetical protein